LGMKKIVLGLVLVLLLSGCMGNTYELYKPIDTSNKKIGMPLSNRYIAGDIKNLFRKNGWTILIKETGGYRTTGVSGANVDLKTIKEPNPAYILYLNQERYDTCFPTFTDALIRYDLSIVNAKSGEQVYFQEGNDCRSRILKKLKIGLNPFFVN
jgi:hypothetical protein